MKTLSSFIAALFLLTLSFSAHAGSIIEELKNEGVLVGYWDFRSGHCQDLSGNSNHGTPTDVQWTNDGVRFPDDTSVVTVTDSAELRLTTGSLIVFGEFLQGTPKSQYDGLIVKRGASTNYQFYIHKTDGQLYYYDGTNIRSGNTVTSGHRYLAVNIADGETPVEYIDGVNQGNFSGTVSVSSNSSDVAIGSYSISSGYNLDDKLQVALITNRPLTDTEHSQLYGELVNMRWPRKPTITAKAGLGLGVELLADGDMETAGTGDWNATNATLSKESGRAMAGDQVLRTTKTSGSTGGARQSVLTVGKEYRITGWVRGDGTAYPRLGDSSGYYWDGTTSTNWQWADIIATAASANFYCYISGGAATNWVEFDNISVREVLHPQIQWKSDWGVPVTVSNVTDGYIGNTPFRRSTGTWKIGTDTINGRTVKTIECVADGIAYMPVSTMGISPSEAAYGTWDFWAYKEDANEIEVAIVADVIGGRSAAGQDGYSVVVEADEDILLTESSAGTPATRITGSESATSDSWERYRITRADDGDFVLYLDGSSIGSVNNEASVTSSDYIVLDFDAGDKLAWSDLAGDHGFAKYKGVVSP